MNVTYTKSPKTVQKVVHILYIILLFVCCILTITYFFYTFSLTSSEKFQFEQIQEKSLDVDNKIAQELQDYLYSNLSRPITSVNTFSTFFKSDESNAAFFQKSELTYLTITC